MRIVIGRGKNRNVLEFPCATIVNRSPVDQQVAAKNMLCNMLGVKDVDAPAKPRRNRKAKGAVEAMAA